GRDRGLDAETAPSAAVVARNRLWRAATLYSPTGSSKPPWRPNAAVDFCPRQPAVAAGSAAVGVVGLCVAAAAGGRQRKCAGERASGRGAAGHRRNRAACGCERRIRATGAVRACRGGAFPRSEG